MGSPPNETKQSKTKQNEKSEWLVTEPKHLENFLQIINFFKTHTLGLLSHWGALLRFKQEPIAVVVDVQGMFNQVKVSMGYRDLLSFPLVAQSC